MVYVKKQEERNAISQNICPDGYYFDGNRCLSNINYEKIVNKECLLPSDGAYEVYISPDGECVANYCSDWSDAGECTAGSGEPIDFTITEYCPNGSVMINGVCKSITNSRLEYSCEEGILNNDKCILNLEKESYLGCEEGYILNQKCNLCVLGE